MSMFDNENYRWRETYFVFFDSSKCPSLEKLQATLRGLSDGFELANVATDPDGRFESMTILAPDSYAAIDISIVSGEEVAEQAETFVKDMKALISDQAEMKKLQRLTELDMRLDLMHFEQVVDTDGLEDDLDEMLDPGALLLVMDALVALCDGVGVDPQSGSIM